MYFQKPGRKSEKSGRKSEILEEIQKTQKIFPKNLWPPCILNVTKNYHFDFPHYKIERCNYESLECMVIKFKRTIKPPNKLNFVNQHIKKLEKK